MKTRIKQKLVILALSVCTISAFAQCPGVITNMTISYGANGTASITPVINGGGVSPSQTMYYWNISPNVSQTSGMMDQQGTFQFPANGTYMVCISYNDSAAMCSSNQFCDTINITNNNSTSCQSGFTYSTDSSCTTYFVNTSIGSNLTYQWNINGSMNASVNPNVVLQNGWNHVTLYSFSGGAFCDSLHQTIYSNCGGTFGSCNSAFTSYTDSNCVTHFTNASTGTNLTYQWYDFSNSSSPLLSTQQDPNLNLTQGQHYIGLYTYSNGQYCDSITQVINVTCGDSTVSCNASFSYYTDSTNCTTNFYNTSTGSNLSYAWYIGGAYFTTANPSVQLSNGNTHVQLYMYSNGQFCDSSDVYVNINCQSVPDSTINNCQVDSYFVVFADSTNAGNYFAYNMSSGTGNLSYVWDFGDGTSSTQQYPFHQYAVPGQYVLCLMVTATNGTTTCTDTYCDSSSVQKMASGFLMSQIAVIPQSVTDMKEENLLKGIVAFPNPINDELTIEMELSANISGVTCTLIDALGKVVLINKIIDPKTTINTSNLDKGFYFLSVSNEEGKTIKTIKLIK